MHFLKHHREMDWPSSYIIKLCNIHLKLLKTITRENSFTLVISSHWFDNVNKDYTNCFQRFWGGKLNSILNCFNSLKYLKLSLKRHVWDTWLWEQVSVFQLSSDKSKFPLSTYNLYREKPQTSHKKIVSCIASPMSDDKLSTS